MWKINGVFYTTHVPDANRWRVLRDYQKVVFYQSNCRFLFHFVTFPKGILLEYVPADQILVSVARNFFIIDIFKYSERKANTVSVAVKKLVGLSEPRTQTKLSLIVMINGGARIY